MKATLRQSFGCHGLTIPLPGNWQVEFWFCPRGTYIPSHVHPHIQSRLIFLGGRMLWQRSAEHREFNWRHIGRSFLVGPTVEHGAVTTGAFGFFANLERWIGSHPKTSAAIDLELA